MEWSPPRDTGTAPARTMPATSLGYHLPVGLAVPRADGHIAAIAHAGALQDGPSQLHVEQLGAALVRVEGGGGADGPGAEARARAVRRALVERDTEHEEVVANGVGGRNERQFQERSDAHVGHRARRPGQMSGIGGHAPPACVLIISNLADLGRGRDCENTPNGARSLCGVTVPGRAALGNRPRWQG